MTLWTPPGADLGCSRVRAENVHEIPVSQRWLAEISALEAVFVSREPGEATSEADEVAEAGRWAHSGRGGGATDL